MADLSRTLFAYSAAPYVRRHSPAGYANYEAYKPWLRDEFCFRCAYCLVRERWFSSGSDIFSVEHIRPRSADPTLAEDYGNLLYACLRCNSARRDQTVLNPCAVAFADHMRVHKNGEIEPLTPEGRSHIRTLRLDDPQLTEFRERVMETGQGLEDIADWNLLRRWVGFPDSLPDLAALRPPGGNSRPLAVQDCWYELRKQGTLPERY